jgi:hypothetical protein
MEEIKEYCFLEKENVQECFDYIFAVKRYFKNIDGGGLSSGTIIDGIIGEFFSEKFNQYKLYHNGECDCIFYNRKFSIKTIKGKSQLALDWSKNKKENSDKEYFTCDIMIFNSKSEEWFKKTKVIPNGLYFISSSFCKQHIQLKQNNKTNSLIDSKNLFKMLQNAFENNLYIPVVHDTNKYQWSALKGIYSS